MDHSTGHLYHSHPNLQDSGRSKGCDLLHRRSPKSRPSSLESAKAMELLGFRKPPKWVWGTPISFPRWFILVMDLGASNFRSWKSCPGKDDSWEVCSWQHLNKTLWENRFWSQLTWRVKKHFPKFLTPQSWIIQSRNLSFQAQCWVF